MLISMLHSWSLGTDGNGPTVGTLLLDYRNKQMLALEETSLTRESKID